MRTAWVLSLIFVIGVVLAGIPRAQAQQTTPNSVQSLDYALFAGGRIAVKVVFEHELRELPDTFTTFHPAVRIVLDFANMRSAVSTQLMEIRQRDLWTMQVVQSGPRVRLIIQLLRPMIKEIRATGNELLITLHRP